MSKAPGVLTDAVRQAARSSVLCWLATVDAQGQPVGGRAKPETLELRVATAARLLMQVD